MIKLYIDTTTAKKSKITIFKNSQILSEIEGESPLITINQALKEASLNLTAIDIFESNPGPGSYTGVRIGAAVVNTLNFALGKKVELVEPIYG